MTGCRRVVASPTVRYTVIVASLFVSALVADSASSQERSALLERASQSRSKGEEGAPIFVYEIADFECTHCARFATEVFPRIDSAYVKTGKVHWVFVNLPVPTHPTSWIAHEAALCAGAISGKFWAMHDRIFETQKEWLNAADPVGALTRFARELNVPAADFAKCTGTDAVAPLLLQDVIFAVSSRVNGTPAFIINNEQSVMGLKTFEEWKAILEPMLRNKGKLD